MRLAVTGGGTGGHIYPALEVARLAADRGAELLYLGSLRGQEGKACMDRGILFQGFPSEPLYSLRTLRGIRSLAKLLRARSMAKQALIAAKPDAVFSTGGYSAGPVVAAARSLRIPYVIHEANSVPGRANLMFARRASAFTCAFRCTLDLKPGLGIVRTGQPIRRELRAAAEGVSQERGKPPRVFILGGSQGSEFLNTVVPLAARSLPDVKFLLATGPKNFEIVQRQVERLELGDRFRVAPYLETEAMVEAYRSASLVIARSGGTCAEIALFRLPSILVPLPTSADQHQLHNAREFDAMEAAVLLPQPVDTSLYSEYTDLLSKWIEKWLLDKPHQQRAFDALAEWDAPDATDRIVGFIEEAAAKKR